MHLFTKLVHVCHVPRSDKAVGSSKGGDAEEPLTEAAQRVAEMFFLEGDGL